MAKFNTAQSFADGDTVTGAKLNNIASQLNIYTGVISEQTAMVATVSTADQLLIADTDNGDSGAANRVTVQKLLNDTLTNGTYTNAQLSGNLNVAQLSTLGTISSTRGTIGIFNSTTGTIAGLNSTNGTVATLNSTTGTIAGLNSTNGTVQTLTASTATITGGTYSGAINSTTGTIATLNSTNGTVATLNSTNGTVATLNSTTGTITGLRSTTGTVATLNSTTGTITNLSTTLAGDFTISQGTGTIGAAKVTPTNLSQPITSGIQVASTSGTAIDFTGIPSWIKKVTVMLNGVKRSATSLIEIRIGTAAGIEATGYKSASGWAGSVNATIVSTTGFATHAAAGAAAADLLHGSMIISTLGSNTWVEQSGFYQEGATSNVQNSGGGSKTLPGVLDRVRVTTLSGTDTFGSGTINIIYEG